jgi:hypothetical protein
MDSLAAEQNTQDIQHITITGQEFQRSTSEDIAKYLGCVVKFDCVTNPWNGLRRSLTVCPDMNQEFRPDPNKFYILNKLQDGFLYVKSLNSCEDQAIYRYWYINIANAGIINFKNDVNRFDIREMHFYKYITPEMKPFLDEKQIAKMDNYRKVILDKYWLSFQNLSDELIEHIINFVQVPISEVL